MSIPESKTVGYECENGHVNTDHDINHAAEDGKKCVCSECDGLLTRKLIPLYECDDCGYVWAYTGNAEHPTCSKCKGKRTNPVE